MPNFYITHFKTETRLRPINRIPLFRAVFPSSPYDNWSQNDALCGKLRVFGLKVEN